MSGFQRILGTAKADFLERIRKFSFFAFAAILIFAVFWFVPKPSGVTSMVIEPTRLLQASDPSWIPMSSAMCGGMLLCILGFAYIKNTVQQDCHAGIFYWIQTSPLKRSTYVLGKFVSNLFLLLLLLGFLMAASFFMMVLHFPGQFIPLYDFFSPFLCLVPGLFFVAAFAVVTDCAPVLRKSSSLSIAIFLCFSIMILTFESLWRINSHLLSIFDFSGFLWMRDSISNTVLAATGHPVTQINLFTSAHRTNAQLKAVAFHGLTPSYQFLIDKLILMASSLILALLASFMLPKSEKAAASVQKQATPKPNNALAWIPPLHFGITHSEALILLKDRTKLWWMTAICLWIATFFSPMDTVCSALFPIAFAWMLPVFSKMGCLEHQTGVDSILRTMPKVPLLLTFDCWNTGLAISLAVGFPTLLRLLFSNQIANFISALVFVVAVPSFALFLGEWTKTNRPFEILYLIVCYLAVNVPQLIFTGAYFTAESTVRVIGLVILTGVMLFLTFTKKLAENHQTA